MGGRDGVLFTSDCDDRAPFAKVLKKILFMRHGEKALSGYFKRHKMKEKIVPK